MCARWGFKCPSRTGDTRQEVTLVAEAAQVPGCAVGFCGTAFAPLWEVGFGRGTEIRYLLAFKKEKYGCVQFGIDP